MRDALSRADGQAPLSRSVLVVGVGNWLRGDDAAGLEVVRRLGDPVQAGVSIEAYEGETVGLLERWRGVDAVVIVDTVRSGAAPGTIHRIDASSDPVASPLRRASSHTIGIAESIELARTLGELPSRVVVYGVEGSRFEAGSSLSDAVLGALDSVARQVAAEAHRLATAPATG